MRGCKRIRLIAWSNTSNSSKASLTDEEWRKMDAEVLQRIEDSVTFAKASPFPTLESAVEDVFAHS